MIFAQKLTHTILIFFFCILGAFLKQNDKTIYKGAFTISGISWAKKYVEIRANLKQVALFWESSDNFL